MAMQGTKSHIEMDYISIHKIIPDRSTISEPMIILKAPNDQSILKSVDQNINCVYNHIDHVNSSLNNNNI